MMLLLSYGAGLRDPMLLIAVTALVATTMPFGYWTKCAQTKS